MSNFCRYFFGRVVFSLTPYLSIFVEIRVNVFQDDAMEYFDNNERNQLKFAWQLWYVYDQKINDSYSFHFGCGYGALGIFKMGVSYHFF